MMQTPRRLPVLTLTGDRICAITRSDNGVLPWFGLPRSLPSRSGVAGCGRSGRWVRGTSHLADRSSDLKSATGPRWVSLSGLTIALMLVI